MLHGTVNFNLITGTGKGVADDDDVIKEIGHAGVLD
jgi:hypothetical protein